MKPLTCEMCGGRDLLKQDGVFVCQFCGTKYSVEEAKKMMIEGTVKIDNSDKTQNYFELARTAKNENDSLTAAKYYGLVLEEVPNSWEAKFYSAYYEAMGCKVGEAYSKCVKLEKYSHAVLTTIKRTEPAAHHEMYALEIAEKINDIALLFLNGNSEEASDEVPNFLLIWGDQLEEVFPDNQMIVSQAAVLWENAIEVIVDTYFSGDKDIDATIANYTEKIKKYNKDYVKPESNMTIHTADSPNNASVEIIKWGHTDFTTVPLVPVPVQYIAPGPDSAGGMSVELKLKNNKGKTIKYATLYVTAYNQLGDPAPCSVHKEATRVLSITGPIEQGKDSGKLIFETIWYNPTITNIQLSRMIVEYSDGSKELYDYRKVNHKSASPSGKRTITITRKWAYVGCALKILVYKDDVEVFQLKAKDSNSIVADNQPFELRLEAKGIPEHRVMIEAGEENLSFKVQVSLPGKIKLERVFQ